LFSLVTVSVSVSLATVPSSAMSAGRHVPLPAGVNAGAARSASGAKA
jgi:hypothetical protein